MGLDVSTHRAALPPAFVVSADEDLRGEIIDVRTGVRATCSPQTWKHSSTQ
jgi:hypothetical protein